jgi:hypothetical protein
VFAPAAAAAVLAGGTLEGAAALAPEAAAAGTAVPLAAGAVPPVLAGLLVAAGGVGKKVA